MKYAVKEYAATAVDIIARRLRVSFLNVQAAEESLPVIVQIMGDELGWDKKERERQTEEAITFLRMQMGKDVNKASQDNIPVSLTKAEIAEYVKRFNALDDGKKGYISINDIRKSLKVLQGIYRFYIDRKKRHQKSVFPIITRKKELTFLMAISQLCLLGFPSRLMAA